MTAGIVSYGVYIPRYRIKVSEIASVWGDQDGEAVSRGLNVVEKSVPDLDEDTITLAVEASRNALDRIQPFDPSVIEAVFVGSESHPYAVKPSAVTVAEAIGAVPNCTASDLEFACKAGTVGMQMVLGMCTAQQIRCGLAIGSDCAQARPGDPLEFTAAAGAGAFLIGFDNPIACLEGTVSYTTDTPDFFRREGKSFPSHGQRFTGIPAYFRHVISASKDLMDRFSLSPEDFDYVCFHSPNGKFPLAAASQLGFDKSKVEDSLVVSKIGNTYSGSSMIGLAAILDVAKEDQRILVTSYGSGAGSDAFSLVTTDRLDAIRNLAPSVSDYIERKTYINYAEYAKHRGKIVKT